MQKQLEFESIQMMNGSVFNGKRIGELVGNIIDKFSQEGLTHDEAQIVLEKAKDSIGEFSKIQSLDLK